MLVEKNSRLRAFRSVSTKFRCAICEIIAALLDLCKKVGRKSRREDLDDL